MPQLTINYSNDIEIDYSTLFNDIEACINQADTTAGVCKCRAYPAVAFRHTHLYVDLKLLNKPHRNQDFMRALSQQCLSVIAQYAPKGCYYALDISFSSKNYVTAKKT